MITLYGIQTCDTVKKARNWLDEQQVQYRFHDFRTDGLEAELVDQLEQALGWERMINRRSTSWRRLDHSVSSDLTADKAKNLMLEYPTLIKRPVLDTGEKFIIGFSIDEYQTLL